jgi:hypothetical protein
MADDEARAARIRRARAAQTRVVEMRMFGGIAFMVARQHVLRSKQGRPDPAAGRQNRRRRPRQPHVRAWDFMKRPMKGMFAVGPQGCATQGAVESWVQMALKHALTLPEK